MKKEDVVYRPCNTRHLIVHNMTCQCCYYLKPMLLLTRLLLSFLQSFLYSFIILMRSFQVLLRKKPSSLFCKLDGARPWESPWQEATHSSKTLVSFTSSTWCNGQNTLQWTLAQVTFIVCWLLRQAYLSKYTCGWYPTQCHRTQHQFSVGPRCPSTADALHALCALLSHEWSGRCTTLQSNCTKSHINITQLRYLLYNKSYSDLRRSLHWMCYPCSYWIDMLSLKAEFLLYLSTTQCKCIGVLTPCILNLTFGWRDWSASWFSHSKQKKKAPVSNGLEAGWTPEQVSTWWQIEKSLPCWESYASPAHSQSHHWLNSPWLIWTKMKFSYNLQYRSETYFIKIH